jgi:hypothetical protein
LYNLGANNVDASVKGSPGTVVKLLPCDHEVMGSSPGNSLLQNCRGRLRTEDPKGPDPSLDPTQAGATRTRLPFSVDASVVVLEIKYSILTRILRILACQVPLVWCR